MRHDTLSLTRGPRLETRSVSAPVVTLRDRSTLEVRHFYPRLGVAAEPARYGLHVYWFLPNNVGVNETTWGQSTFYRDSQVFLRLLAPTHTVAELADIEHGSNPLVLLRRQLPRLLVGHNIRGRATVSMARIAGAELADALVREGNALVNDVRARTGDAAPAAAAVTAFCAAGRQAIAAIRSTRRAALVYRGVAHPDLGPALAFAEEYAACTFAEVLSTVALALERSEGLCDGTGTSLRARLEIGATLEALYASCRDQGFTTPEDPDPEYYSYRIGRIKKELQRTLYVSARTSGRDPVVANYAAMVAASLAATWATLAQIPLLGGNLLSSAKGWLLFGGAVAAYVLKDRIKDWVKVRLSRRWLAWDHDNRLAISSDSPLGELSGRQRERIRWMAPDAVPPPVRGLRQAQRTVSGSSSRLETVLHYQQELELVRPAHSSMPADYGMQQILRCSVDDLLRRLDEPSEAVNVFTREQGTFDRRDVPKVYHLNIVAVAEDLATGEVQGARFRVVVDRNGILRIEPVLQR